jgi:hypothetical protein
MLKNKFFPLLSAILLGFTLGTYFKVYWEESRFIIAEWEEPPLVVVCPDSAVTKYRVHKAIEWWGIRNYEVVGIHWDVNNKMCSKRTFARSTIFIRGEGEVPLDTYAVTYKMTLASKMVSAQIILPNENIYMPRLLEHELGHAFGMRHVEEVGHIMHPIHEHGGELFWIPD